MRSDRDVPVKANVGQENNIHTKLEFSGQNKMQALLFFNYRNANCKSLTQITIVVTDREKFVVSLWVDTGVALTVQHGDHKPYMLDTCCVDIFRYLQN